jgi:hypothetical protein
VAYIIRQATDTRDDTTYKSLTRETMLQLRLKSDTFGKFYSRCRQWITDKMRAEVSYRDFVAFDVHYVASLTLRCLVESGEKDGKGSTARRSGVGYCKECVTQ